MLITRAIINIRCYGPVQTEWANVVIELFVIIQSWLVITLWFFLMLREIPTYFSCKNVPHIPIILMPRITTVSGHMINTHIISHALKESSIIWIQSSIVAACSLIDHSQSMLLRFLWLNSYLNRPSEMFSLPVWIICPDNIFPLLNDLFFLESQVTSQHS